MDTILLGIGAGISGQYGTLLDYVMFAVILFYMFTIAGIFVLRKKMPDADRPYRAFGYPVVPMIYILLALFFCKCPVHLD